MTDNIDAPPPLEHAVTVALKSDELQGVFSEYGELAVDAFIAEGIAKEIPVVSSVLAGIRVWGRVRDHLLTEKLIEFLRTFKDVPTNERLAMIERLESDPDYGRKVGKHLIELLDRNESHLKPAIFARIFRAYAKGEMDLMMFNRMTYAVTQLPAFEFPMIRRFAGHDPRPSHPASNANLVTAGLLDLGTGPLGGRVTYCISGLGDAFLRLNLDGFTPREGS